MPTISLDMTAEASRFELPSVIARGTRDDVIFRYACSLRSLNVGEDELRAAVFEANATRCDPPLPDRQVERKVQQALGYEGGHGGSLGRPPARRERHVRKIDFVGCPDLLPDCSGMEPIDQARAWLDALFFEEDVVCLCFDVVSKFPATEWYAYAGQLLDVGDPTLGTLLSQVKPSIGLYAVQNPITDKTREVKNHDDPLRDVEGMRRDRDVADLRWALVECDRLPPDEQLERICALLFEEQDTGWKCKAITWSGNKSYHAIVYVGAKSPEEYAEKVEELYAYCDANGLPVDHACRNPSRLTRMPGVRRGAQRQSLRWCDSCLTYQT